jgi:hypothetical protein
LERSEKDELPSVEAQDIGGVMMRDEERAKRLRARCRLAISLPQEIEAIMEAFAAIREECAKVADGRSTIRFHGDHAREYRDGYLGACYDIAYGIRSMNTAQPAKAQEGA